MTQTRLVISLTYDPLSALRWVRPASSSLHHHPRSLVFVTRLMITFSQSSATIIYIFSDLVPSAKDNHCVHVLTAYNFNCSLLNEVLSRDSCIKTFVFACLTKMNHNNLLILKHLMSSTQFVLNSSFAV